MRPAARRSAPPLAAAAVLASALALAGAAPEGAPPAGPAPPVAPPPAVRAGEGGDGAVVVRNINWDLSPNVQTFAAVPERAVSVNGSATEILLALGAGDRIAGIAYQDNPVLPEFREAFDGLRILSARYPGRERVLGLRPDLLVGWHSAFAPQNLGDARNWNSLGVGTFILADSSPLGKSLEAVYGDILGLGAIFRRDAEARAIVEGMRAEIGAAAARGAAAVGAAGGRRPRALLLEPFPGGRLVAYGPDSTAGRILEALGAENASSSNGERGKEGVIASDPDAVVIVYMDSWYGESEKLLERFLTDPILSRLKASRTRRIGFMPLAECYAPGVRLAAGVRRMEEIVFGGQAPPGG